MRIFHIVLVRGKGHSQCINGSKKIQIWRNTLYLALQLKTTLLITTKMTLKKCPFLLRTHIMHSIFMWIFVLWSPSKRIVDFICCMVLVIWMTLATLWWHEEACCLSHFITSPFLQLKNINDVKASSVYLHKTKSSTSAEQSVTVTYVRVMELLKTIKPRWAQSAAWISKVMCGENK